MTAWGRALDILHEAGPTEIFARIASHALRLWGIQRRFVHLDTTSPDSGPGRQCPKPHLSPSDRSVSRPTAGGGDAIPGSG